MWFKVDDNINASRKLADLREISAEADEDNPGALWAEAMALWTVAGSWCGNQLTDGRITIARMQPLVPFCPRRGAQALCDVGMWNRIEWSEGEGEKARTRKGCEFHDWESCNPTRAQVEAERAKAAERQRKSRKKKKEGAARDSGEVTSDVTRDKPGVTPPVTRDGANVTSDDGVSHGAQCHSAPTRPDPTRPEVATATPPRAREPSPPKRVTPEQAQQRRRQKIRDRIQGPPTPGGWLNMAELIYLDVLGDMRFWAGSSSQHVATMGAKIALAESAAPPLGMTPGQWLAQEAEAFAGAVKRGDMVPESNATGLFVKGVGTWFDKYGSAQEAA